MGELKAILQKLNPQARVVESQFSRIDPVQIVNTRLFDFDQASQSAGWSQALQNHQNGIGHVPETEEYGLSSFVFRDRRPFHPARLWHYLSEDFPAGIIRSNRNADAGAVLAGVAARRRAEFQSGGGLVGVDAFCRAHPVGGFSRKPQSIEARWHKRFGDRQNELVIIGQDLDQEQLIAELQQCLCTELEIKDMEGGRAFMDPFPVWA